MGKIQYGEDMQKLQRKLIPFNIAVIILCLVAAFTILFAPFITIDVGKAVTALSEQENSSDGNQSSSGDASNYLSVFNGVNMKVSLSAMTVQKFAFAEDPSTIVVDMVTDVIEKNEDDILAAVATLAAQETLTSMAGEGSKDKVSAAVKDMDMKKVINKMNDIDGATNRNDAETRINAFSDELINEMNTALNKIGGDNPLVGSEQDVKDEINKLFLDMYDKAAEQGVQFSVESGICLYVSEQMQKEGGEPVTSYKDLLNLLMKGNNGNSNSNNGGNYVAKVSAPANENEQTPSDGSSSDNTMDELNKTLNEIAGYAKYVYYAFLGFAGLYIILAIFALIKIFTKNKRFVMWYVKLFGFLPCLLFGVLPLVAGMIIPIIITGSEGAMIASIVGAISSLTWISGVCYLLLWGISIFWGFPIKHKIRKLKKEYKRGAKAAA